ncbi:hypothetical protein KAK06_01765 [Ideonella sp. 4Y11]|uniref:Uncharacterized protein n=1 Tax=Ideonella aquatica TaxID=2824119 RepID=A0A941BJN5_9BURK|nr:hypothetical protein [Ideonella aquatica]MBQ0957674.1 hypothetical protein [Ideonella aquatica]
MTTWRTSCRLGCLAALLGLTTLPSLARELAYLATPGYGTPFAFLIDWQPQGRASVVSFDGAGAGAVSSEASNRVITLDAPISVWTTADEPTDCDGGYPNVRIDIQRIGVRPVQGNSRLGQSAITQAGTTTVLSGCATGRVTPWGGIAETGGLLVNHSDRSRFASPDAVSVGSQWVGFSDAIYPYYSGATANPASVEEGQLRFRDGGAVVPLTRRADGWFVLDLGDRGQRGYLRIAEADGSGQEAWLAAMWSGDRPVQVARSPMVHPQLGDWGGLRKSARHWLLTPTEFTQTQVFVDLLSNGSGEWLHVDRDTGETDHLPLLRWRVNGSVIELDTDAFNGAYRVRRWEWLARTGRNVSVLESMIEYQPDGTQRVVLRPRLNLYRDEGRR